MRSSRFTIVSALVLSLALIFALNLVVVGADLDVYVTVPSSMSLNIDSTTYDFGSITSSALDTGYVGTGRVRGYANVLTVDSNADWQVKVKAADSNLGTNGSYTKPLGDFKFKASKKNDPYNKFTADISTYTAISDTDQILASGSPGEGLEIGVDYKILLSYQDRGGDYSVTLTYTLASE